MLPPFHTWAVPGYLLKRGNQLKWASQAAEPGRLRHQWILVLHLPRRALCNLGEESLIN